MRHLIVVGVDLAEGQEAVALAAIVDERRLQGRLDPGDLGQIDVAFELLLGRCLEIEINELLLFVDDHHPGFFRLGGIDEHTFRHSE